MDKYNIRFTRLEEEIFRVFCVKAGEKLNQRQIAKLLGVSPTAVAKSLPNLERAGLLKIERSKTMNLILVSLNREENKCVHLKRVENLRRLYESGILEYLEGVYPGAAVILFGSYGKGEDVVSSDIDLAVIGSKEKMLDLEDYEKRLERKIRINYYKSLKELSLELKENIFNGIVLSGAVEL